jgi:ribulose-phosphate 3-epimerase
MTTAPLIVPSLLPADQGALGVACEELADAGVDRIQWDVMDGCFVPNLTVGPGVIAACRNRVTVPFEAHLMVVEPDAMLGRYVDAGCDLVIVHAEACLHLHRTLTRIRELGARAGVALNPHTPVEAILHTLDELDLVLVMTVNPGFGGQRYISAMESKVRHLRQLVDGTALSIELEVDGGITDTTIVGAARSGADVFISGSWLFNHADGKAAATSLLRMAAQSAAPGPT